MSNKVEAMSDRIKASELPGFRWVEGLTVYVEEYGQEVYLDDDMARLLNEDSYPLKGDRPEVRYWRDDETARELFCQLRYVFRDESFCHISGPEMSRVEIYPRGEECRTFEASTFGDAVVEAWHWVGVGRYE